MFPISHCQFFDGCGIFFRSFRAWNWVGLNSFTLCARQRLAFWDVCGPRCIYRWLYQLIGGLQHVDSTQDPNPHGKGSVPARGIFSINPILDLPDPTPLTNLPSIPTSGLLGLINVILHFRSSLLCFIADTLDFNYKNAAFRCNTKVITQPESISCSVCVCVCASMCFRTLTYIYYHSKVTFFKRH